MSFQAGDIRRRLSECVNTPKSKSGFKRDPEDPSAAVLKEPWAEKVERHNGECTANAASKAAKPMTLPFARAFD